MEHISHMLWCSLMMRMVVDCDNEKLTMTTMMTRRTVEVFYLPGETKRLGQMLTRMSMLLTTEVRSNQLEKIQLSITLKIYILTKLTTHYISIQVWSPWQTSILTGKTICQGPSLKWLQIKGNGGGGNPEDSKVETLFYSRHWWFPNHWDDVTLPKTGFFHLE